MWMDKNVLYCFLKDDGGCVPYHRGCVMEIIDCFINQRRKWETAHHKEPIAPLSYRRPDLSKARLVKGLHTEDEKIEVLLHHAARYSDSDFFHYHNFFELIYMYCGGSVQHFKDKDLPLKEHDILILNPHTIHAPYTTEEQDCLFNIIISKSLFEQSMMSLLYDNHMFTGFIVDCLYHASTATEYLYFPAKNNDLSDDTTFIIENIIAEYIHKKEGYKNSMRAWLVLLFLNLSRAHSQLHPLKQGDFDSRGIIAEIISYINVHAKDVSLTTLSEQFSYSPEYLSRIIKKNTGQSFTDLVKKFRMEKAKYYLETSDLPISTIMDLSGFQSINYFHRVFKQYNGISPSAYRKKMRETMEQKSDSALEQNK